jgi:hypothetical protein
MQLSLNETMNRLELLIRSGYPVIYVVSHEESRVLDYLSRVFRVIKRESTGKHLLRWQMGSAMKEAELGAYGDAEMERHPRWLHLPARPDQVNWQDRGNASPEDAFNNLSKATADGVNPLPSEQVNPTLGDALVVFYDLHPYLQDGSVPGPLVRPVRNLADNFRRYYERHRAGGRFYKTMVIVGPSSGRLSPELERDLIVVDFPLPEEDELLETLDGMTGRVGGVLAGPQVLSFPDTIDANDAEDLFGKDYKALPRLDEQYRQKLSRQIAGAGRGLTLEDYKLGLNGFAVNGKPLTPGLVEDMLNLKAKVIKNEAIQYTPHAEVELGGLKGIQDYLRLRSAPAVDPELREKYHLPSPKGLMLCGASGGGKSQLAKLIAKSFNLALLRLDIGSLFGSYIGQSEENTRRALRLAEALAPVVLWLDEIDKAFAGAGDSAGDGGVSARVLGYFLTWMAEKKDSVYVVATANDFLKIVNRFPEFTRKGRFDECVWVGLPDQDARAKIFEIYLRPVVGDDNRPNGDGRLRLAAADVRKFLANQGGGDVIDKPLERFCTYLADSRHSLDMTGAEIEYAVQDALYGAYEADMARGALDTLTPQRIVDSVRKLQARALYRLNTGSGKATNTERSRLDELEAAAMARGFMRA